MVNSQTICPAGPHQKLAHWMAPGNRKTVERAAAVLVVALSALVWYSLDAALVLGAAMAAGLLAFMLLRPEAATLVVIAALYLNVAVIAVRQFQVPQTVAGAFVLLLLIPLFDHVVLKKERLIADRVLRVMLLAYLPVLFISAALSRYPQHSSERIVSFVLEGVVLYFLIVNTVRTPAVLRKAVWVLVLAGGLMGALSIYQELTGSHGNSLGGLAQLEEKQIGTGERANRGQAATRSRLAGPIGEANRYAQVLAVLLPLGVIRLRSERSQRLRIIAALASLAILGGVLLTFSRGAAVAIGLLFLAATFLGYFKVRHLLAGTAAGILLIALLAPEYAHRLSTLAGLSSGGLRAADSAIRGRFTENLASLKIFLEHPVLGVGPGQTSLYTAKYGNEMALRRMEGKRRGHSMYLEELADTGLVGFVVFISMPLWIIRELLRARHHWLHRRPEYADLASGFLLAVLTYLTSAIFLHLSYQRYYWLLLALAAAAVHALRRQESFAWDAEPIAVESALPRTWLRSRIPLFGASLRKLK